MTPGTRIGARYLLLEPIGSGGEARVHRARDESGGSNVAIRLARQADGFDPAAAPAIFHENWVRLLDSGIDPEAGPYQIFELLEGETLHQAVQRAPLERTEWLAFVSQSLNAVEALHGAGWIHGDLNAENIFFTKSPPPSWKLLELPFLRFATPAGRSALFGSIHTLAPEQIDGVPADARSDLYALGCLAYYAASGEYPAAGATSQEIAVSRLLYAPPPLQEKIRHLPSPWCAWVMRLLEREPQKRFDGTSSARECLEFILK